MGSLVDTVVKVMLLMKESKIFFLCSCYGPTESLHTELELLLLFLPCEYCSLTAAKSEWKHFALGCVQV